MSLRSQRKVLPGFGLTLGYTLFYLGLVILIPLGYLAWRSTQVGGETSFWEIVSSRRVVRSYWNSFFASFLAASINVPLGLLVAWVLARYRFWGRRFLDALVDMPFALPTAVAGIALARLFAEKGALGQTLKSIGFEYPWPAWVGFEGRSWPWEIKWFDSVSKAPLGIVAAMVFIGLPFVVRTVQPVIEDLNIEEEESAASLGATRWQIFHRVIFPQLLPAILTGFALAFARGLGEFGSVVFITGGNTQSEIAPEKIIQRLESGADIEESVSQATAIAVMMLAASFVMLLVINLLQRWVVRRGTGK